MTSSLARVPSSLLSAVRRAQPTLSRSFTAYTITQDKCSALRTHSLSASTLRFTPLPSHSVRRFSAKSKENTEETKDDKQQAAAGGEEEKGNAFVGVLIILGVVGGAAYAVKYFFFTEKKIEEESDEAAPAKQGWWDWMTGVRTHKLTHTHDEIK